MMERLQATWRVELPPGYDGELQFMGHLWWVVAAWWSVEVGWSVV